ncbi:hypothetical protein L0F63_000535 [Massospora cicadina]|nr:hypothetical protein L0F63_000535 [Massospora cicadina]
MPRIAEGLLTTDLDSLAFSIYDDASEEGLPRDADSAKSEADIACREFSTVFMDYDNPHPPRDAPAIRRTAHIKFGYQVVPPSSKCQPQSEYGVYVSDAMMRLLKSTLYIKEAEPKCPIYIYSIKPPYYSGEEKRHYYKIRRQLNIRHNNREKLKRCPMMQSIQSRQYRANLGLLKRTSPTCGKLFMTLLRCKLTNNFTALSRYEVFGC